MKKMSLKTAERKYEHTAKDKREDRKGARELMKHAEKHREGKHRK